MISTTKFCETRFWKRKPDGTVIDRNYRTRYIQECKRSFDRNEDFLGVKEDETNEHHKSTIEALKAAALEWTFEQMSRLILWEGGVVLLWKTISIISLKGSVYKQERRFISTIFLSNTHPISNFEYA